MQRLYIEHAQRTEAEMSCEIDIYVPLTLRFNQGLIKSDSEMYIFYRHEHSLIEVQFGIPFGELFEIAVVFLDRMQFLQDSWEPYNLLYSDIPMALVFQGIIPHVEQGLPVVTQQGLCCLYVYNNAILITLSAKFLDDSALIFKYSDRLDIVVDKDLEILAFVLKNMTQQEYDTLKVYAASEKHLLSNGIVESVRFCRRQPMLQANAIKYELICFTTINFGYFLHYGWQRCLLSELDSIVCAEYLMEHEIALKDQLIFELAAITGLNQIKDVQKLFNSIKSDEESYEKNAYLYNKLWMYLVFFTDTAAYRKK